MVKPILSRTLSLKLNPRPLRLAYMVRDRAGVLDATRLLSHIWGGRTDVLLPQPTTDDEQNELLDAVTDFDPDFIIFDPEEVSPELAALLAPVPCIKRRLRAGEMDEFINALNPLVLGSGQISEPYSLLHEQYPSGLTESRIRVLEHGGPFDFLTKVVWGDPPEGVSAWLQNKFGAKALRPPQSVEELVRSSLVGNERVKPIDVSLTGASAGLSYRGLEGLADPLGGALTQNEMSIFLFLDDGHSLATVCAYWNTRAAASSNKLLLPLAPVQASLTQVLKCIRSSRPIDNWIVVTEMDETAAENLLGAFRDVIAEGALGGEVAVISAGFKYRIPPFRTYSGGSTSMTLAVGNDDEIRFVAPKPNNSYGSTLFGLDAEVTRSDGDKLSVPATVEIALLLSNSADRIRRYDANEAGLGDLWLHRGLRVRPRRDGIAAVTTPEEESVWYFPAPDRLIERFLRGRGIRVSGNRHTRYAVGVANRLGGLDDAMAFTRAGGLAPLKPLLKVEAHQAGLQSQRIQHLLHTEHGLSEDAARQAMAVHFPRLLETGLVRRGFALTCRHCDLTEWYSVSNLDEFIECAGCGEQFQLTGLRLDFSFTINELARRMAREGGFAVLSTAAVLDALGGGQNLQLGGDLTRASDREPFAEIDLLSLNRDALIVAECKDYKDLTDQTYLEQVRESLRKSIATAAPALGAKIVVLGIACERWNQDLFAIVSEAAATSSEVGIAVHLVLNGQLHLLGDEAPASLHSLSFANLLVARETNRDARVLGTLPNTFGGGRRASVVANEVIDAWEFNALTRPEWGGDVR